VLVTKGGSVGRKSAVANLLGHLYDALAESADAPMTPARHRPAVPGEFASSREKVAAT